MRNNNLNLTIRRVPQSRMLKSEMADYADRTIDIVQEFGPDSVIINPLFDLLKAKQGDIEILRLIYGIDSERIKVNNIKGELMLKISALKLQVKMLKRQHRKLDLNVIENAINTYLLRLDKTKNDKQLNQKVEGFLDLLETNEELIESLEEFNLIEYITPIVGAHDAFNNAMAKRVRLLSKRPNVSTRTVVKGLFNTINNLFKAIEVGHLVSLLTVVEGEEGEDVQTDFSPLIRELDQLSEMYIRSISIRAANNQRKADEQAKAEANGEAGSDTGIEGTETPAEGDAPAVANYNAYRTDAPDFTAEEVDEFADADEDEELGDEVDEDYLQ